MESKVIKYHSSFDQDITLSSIFYVDKPRDLVVGTCSGLGNIGIGFIGGVISLIGFPICGTINEGAFGFAKGIGAGLISCIGLSGTGTFFGIKQLINGLINTPDACYSYYNGKIWDLENKKWIFYNLNHELDYINKQQIYESYYFNNQIIEKEYYNILQLNTNCSQEDIKASYRRLSLKYHPDRNITSKDEGNKFSQISEAYQILYNPETRRLYNLNGKDAIKNTIINYNDIYSLFFETDKFDFFIGEIKGINYIINENINDNIELKKFNIKKREVILANNLCKLLTVFSEKTDDIDEYYQKITDELNINCFGNYITNIIGNIYIEKAQNYLSFFRSIFNNIKSNSRNIENYFSLFTSLVKSNYQALNDNNNLTKSMVDFILNFITFDLEETIGNSCNKILNDFNVSYKERIDRANGLIYIGQKFLKNKIKYEDARIFLKKKLILIG